MSRKRLLGTFASGKIIFVPPPAKLPKHPVRLLRATLGLSRSQFAELIGTSIDTIVSVENDRLRLSAKLARRINFITGAQYSELLKGKSGRLKNAAGRRYTIGDYMRRKRRYENPPPDVVQLLSSNLARRSADVLVNAAKRGFLPVAYCDILDSIETYEYPKSQ